MNDARDNELHIGDTVITMDWNGAGDPVLTQHVVHGFDAQAGNVICGMTYAAIHARVPGAQGRKHAPTPRQIAQRTEARYALAVNTVYLASQS